jgi:glycosyltransferase involved in cell wall biosynthesis
VRRQRWLVLATAVPAGGALGGVVRYTTELCRALAARADIELSLLGDRAAAGELAGLAGGAARVRTLPIALPGAVGALVEATHPWARTGGFDVVLGTKHIVPRTSGALRMLTVHDMLLLDRTADFPAAKRLLLPGPYRRSIRAADVLLCVSAATRARLAAHDHGAAQRAAVVPLATATALRAAQPEPLPSLRGRRFALVVGDASARKNLATVVAAWPAVRAAVPDAVLALAGPPDWSRSGSSEAYRQLLATGAAVALGHVTDAQLRWCYEHAALVACPSIAEGFGLPVAEALDFGAPVLVSRDPALVEAARGRATAVLPATEPAAWSAALIAALAAPGAGRPTSPGAPEVRSWDDVAEDTVRAARDAAGRQPVGSR